jgi:heptose I phosphotransferase
VQGGVAEVYLRQDLTGDTIAAGAAPSALAGAEQVLAWADSVAAAASPADIYRSKEGRKTLRFRQRQRSYFLKLHSGIGWREVFKNLLQFRLPILGASNEYRAILALQSIGVDTLSVAAYARSGSNPATQRSMIVTDDLVGTVSLEDYCADWARRPPAFALRLRLLRKLADSSRRMHGAGINHRDFYICHFHLDESTLDQPVPRCYMIDLHRAQLRRAVPRRWREKDLAGLYFSAMDCGLTQRDLLRFIRHYSDGGLRHALGRENRLWQRVQTKAERLYCREHGRPPPQPGKGTG